MSRELRHNHQPSDGPDYDGCPACIDYYHDCEAELDRLSELDVEVEP